MLLPGSTAAASRETHLVFTRDFGTKRVAVWIADGEGRHAHRLAAGNYGVISPRGDVVAIDRGENDLYLVDSDGSGERLLARHTKPYRWTPDGRTLLVYRDRSLFGLDVRSGRTRLLVRDGAYEASVSPDSRAVAYSTGGCGEAADLRVVGLDGRGRRQITHDGRSAFPLWGPRHITFARLLRSCMSPSLWRVRPDGSRLRPVLARAPKRFVDNGYYGFSPLGWLAGWQELVLGLRSEWGDEAVVLHVPSGRLRHLHRYVDDVAADGALVGTQGGAEGPYTIIVFRTSGGRALVVARGSVCCADWNR